MEQRRAARPTDPEAARFQEAGVELRRLMGAVLNAVRTMGKTRVQLTVVQDNERAWRMYARRGFVRCGEHTGSDGLAYFTMTADLL